MLQDIPTFDEQESSKLEDWFIDIETVTDTITETHTCLAEAKSCGLTRTLICKATQTGKCWDEIKGILRLELCNANIHTYTSRFMEIHQRSIKLWSPTSSASKQQQTSVVFENDTVAIHIFAKGLRYAPTIASKIYKKDPQTLAEVIKLVEKLSAAHQLTTALTPSTFIMMSGDDECFVCGWTGHFGSHCSDAQCYGSDEFGHFAQDFLHKVPPSGKPCHHRRSHSRHRYTHNQRDKSHSYNGLSHRRYYSRSHSCLHSHCDRSSSFRRHTLHHPSANEYFHYPSCHDTNRHSHTPSCTHHFSCRNHSCHAMDQSESHSSSSHHAEQDSQLRETKQGP